MALAAIATMAISTGTATALFSVVDGVLLKPLPYPRPDRLVIVNRTYPDWTGDPIREKSWDRISLSYPEFFDVRAHTRTLDLLAVRTTLLALLPPDHASGARQLNVSVVSASYFPLFGVSAVAGRLFDASDDVSDHRVVLLDEGFWRAHFGADPTIIGRSLPLAEGGRTIAGIVPASFRMPGWKPDVWEPLSAVPASWRADNNRYLDAVARLHDGVTREDAEREMATLLRANFRYASRTGARVTFLRERMLAAVRTPLFILLGGALLLLVMACANLAGFLVGEAATRVQEMRVRTALGAARGRLVRQLLVESALLVGAGSAAGMVIAAWSSRALVALAPSTVPRLTEVALDGRALGFALAAAAAAALLSGTLPALVLAREGSAGGSVRVTSGNRRVQMRLLTIQLAVGVTLLAGAALFLRTLQNLEHVETGFSQGHLVVARATLPQPLYTQERQYRDYFARAEAAIAALPGVTAAAVSSTPPFAGGGGASTSIQLGPDALGGSREVEAQRRYVSPTYFTVLDVPLLSGANFSTSDSDAGDIRVIVSRAMARRFWRGDPVGHTFSQGKVHFVVIGMVGDVRDMALWAEPEATFYISTVQQSPWSTMRVLARTALPPAALVESARKELQAVDPGVPIDEVTTMEQLVSTSLESQRYRAVLLAALALVAAALAAVGLYGALARAVAERRREIGVRLALGARPAQVVRLCLREAARPALLGALLGALGAGAIARVSAALLFGVGALDPATLLIVCASAGVIALVGGYVPARRAARVDPAVALRID